MPLPIITSLYYNNFVNIHWYLGYFRRINPIIGILGCRRMIRVWIWICGRTAPSLQTPCLTAFREWRIRRPWNNQKSVFDNSRSRPRHPGSESLLISKNVSSRRRKYSFSLLSDDVVGSGCEFSRPRPWWSWGHARGPYWVPWPKASAAWPLDRGQTEYI